MRSGKHPWIALSIGAWLGCHGAVRPSGPKEAELMLRVQVESPGGFRLLAPGDVLGSERFAFQIETGQPLHLYAGRVAAGGWEPLQSEDGAPAGAGPAGLMAHLPEGGGWFRLVGAGGAERLCLLASRAALSPAEVAQRWAEEDGGRGEKPPPPKPDPKDRKTDTLTNKGRGFDEASRTLRGRLSAAGRATLCLSIRHP